MVQILATIGSQIRKSICKLTEIKQVLTLFLNINRLNTESDKVVELVVDILASRKSSVVKTFIRLCANVTLLHTRIFPYHIPSYIILAVQILKTMPALQNIFIVCTDI